MNHPNQDIVEQLTKSRADIILDLVQCTESEMDDLTRELFDIDRLIGRIQREILRT